MRFPIKPELLMDLLKPATTEIVKPPQPGVMETLDKIKTGVMSTLKSYTATA